MRIDPNEIKISIIEYPEINGRRRFVYRARYKALTSIHETYFDAEDVELSEDDFRKMVKFEFEERLKELPKRDAKLCEVKDVKIDRLRNPELTTYQRYQATIRDRHFTMMADGLFVPYLSGLEFRKFVRDSYNLGMI